MEIVYLADHMGWARLLAGWHVTAWQALYPGWSEEDAFRELLGHGERCSVPTTFLVLEKGECLGSVSLLEEDAPEFVPFSPWLGNLYVCGSARRRGIGGRLVLRAEEEARKLGVSRLYLFTEDQEDFYVRLGWQCLRYDVLAGKSVVIMEKVLQGILKDQ